MKTTLKDFLNNTEDTILYIDTEQGLEKVKEPVELIQVTGILSDEEVETMLKENHIVHVGGMVSDEPIKRGDTIYLTALFKKPSLSYSSQEQGVIQCRIVDIFTGLSKLNSIMKK